MDRGKNLILLVYIHRTKASYWQGGGRRVIPG